MLVLTFMIGITCGTPANLPEGQCNPPRIQYAAASDEAQAAKDLIACQQSLGSLYNELEKRGAIFDSLLYCEQRKVGMQR